MPNAIVFKFTYMSPIGPGQRPVRSAPPPSEAASKYMQESCQFQKRLPITHWQKTAFLIMQLPRSSFRSCRSGNYEMPESVGWLYTSKIFISIIVQRRPAAIKLRLIHRDHHRGDFDRTRRQKTAVRGARTRHPTDVVFLSYRVRKQRAINAHSLTNRPRQCVSLT